MQFINLTKHAINIFDVEGKNQIVVLPPSGQEARVAVKSEVVGLEEGIPLLATTFGQVENLPASVEATIYVVSLAVRSALPERKDLASPGELLRDDEGKPKGCKGLVVNR